MTDSQPKTPAAETSPGASAPKDGPGAVHEVTAVHRPAPGSTVIVEVPPGTPLKVDFASTDAKYVVLDVDLVMMFPDGAKIILPGYAFGLVSGQESTTEFSDKSMDSQQLFALVNDLHLLDDNTMPSMGSSADAGQAAKADAPPPPQDPPNPPPPPPASPSSKFTGVADFEKPPGDDDISNITQTSTATDVAPPSSGSPPSHTNTFTSNFTSNNVGTNNGNVLSASLSIKLLGVSGDITSPLPSGGEVIRGAASVTAATTDDAFAVQQAAKTIVGTAGGSIIYADDPNQMPSGTFERLIDVTASLPVAGLVAQSVTITGLPSGFRINNAVQEGSNWVLSLNPSDPNHFQLQLVYTLPGPNAVADATGVFSNFTLTALLTATSAAGATELFQGTQVFVIKDVMTADDVLIGGQNGAAAIYALNANPPGTSILGVGGDNTIYAGPGADTLDGGSGTNLVSYAYSNGGVTVNLQTGLGTAGYAKGDVLSDFNQIEGSRYADYLAGQTAGHDTFIGSGGADTIVGAGDDNTVDYSKSPTGVTVNLTTGVGIGGYADGNHLTDIANVIGSATGANSLIGTTGANSISGGNGGDTIDGLGGDDVIVDGSGANTIYYHGTEISIAAGSGANNTLALDAAVNLNLAATANQAASGTTTLTGFANVNATAVAAAISIFGSTGAYTILGGSGNDRRRRRRRRHQRRLRGRSHLFSRQ